MLSGFLQRTDPAVLQAISSLQRQREYRGRDEPMLTPAERAIVDAWVYQVVMRS
jgi:hypothetical protein